MCISSYTSKGKSYNIVQRYGDECSSIHVHVVSVMQFRPTSGCSPGKAHVPITSVPGRSRRRFSFSCSSKSS